VDPGEPEMVDTPGHPDPTLHEAERAKATAGTSSFAMHRQCNCQVPTWAGEPR